ncbi:ABC transporter family substrate-binding protein [Actinoalloteichus caeruleus]|uniref:Peptide/nickel transport system substrate-binding protein n=1 Tax=Actinoalloteichus caeruleus DSM 43889 TaxID=1120930 RepID=A0ABT1JIH0_ACTCY|nr:ABC transporter family substrate-binding protein [Actinoalloteichus caeruleus]MCP2332304.1 peptide/nickel transport system substrate-binding protein [Actinoalloteichus caeruleus DSM 43889]
MRRTRSVAAVAVTMSAALVLSACGGGGGDSDNNGGGGGGLNDSSATGGKGNNGDGTYNVPEVEQGGDVTVTHDAAYTSYNNGARSANNFNNTLVLNTMISEPFVVTDTMEILLNADVMESAEVTSEDPQVVEWKIREGVTWSDGEPWDCSDFYLSWFSKSRLATTEDGGELFAPASTTGYDIMTGSCEDDRTFVGEFSETYADWTGLFGSKAILPSHILEQETGIEDVLELSADSPQEELDAAAEFWNEGWNGFNPDLMPSSGPYMFDSWQQGTSVTVVRNPEWIGNPGGPDSITLQNIADANAQVTALQDQQVHVIAPQANSETAEQLQALTSQGVTYEAKAGLTFEHLDINLAREKFQDLALRQAFAACVDREELVDKLLKSVDPEAAPLGSLLFLPEEPGYEDLYSDITGQGADAAKEILEEGGWTQGSDGVYEKDGERASLTISHTALDRRTDSVALIQGTCAEAGIEVINDTDDNFLDTRVSEGDYDVALFAWVGTPYKASKASLYSIGGGQNWSGWENQEATDQFETVKNSLDEDERNAALSAADKAYAEDVLSIPLFQVPDAWAYAENVDHVTYQGSDGVTWNAAEWEVTS